MAKQPLPVSKDDEWLRRFLERGGSVATSGGTPIEASQIQQLLDATGGATTEEQATAPIPEPEMSPPQKAEIATEEARAERIRQQIAAHDQAAASREEQAEVMREQQARATEERQRLENLQAARQTTSQARQAIDRALSPAKQLADRVASAKTPGGNGFLLLIILIVLFAVVRVNAAGDTRLKQLWYSLNGRAALQGRETLTAGEQAVDVFGQDIANLGAAAQALSVQITNAENKAIESIPVLGGIFDLFRNLPGGVEG